MWSVDRLKTGLPRMGSGARRPLLLATTAVMLVATGCGSRLPHGQIVADARGVASVTPATGARDEAAVEESAASPATDAVGEAAAATVSAGSGVAPTAGGSTSAAPSRNPGAPVPGGPGAPSARAGGPSPAGSASSAGAAVPVASRPSGAAGASSAGGTAPGNPGGGTGCTPGQPPIKIGTIGAFSGVVGQATVTGLKAVQAWVQYINDRGGVSCHPVKHLSGDDGSDPARNQALHRQMAEQEGVIAFVFPLSPIADSGSRDYINEKQIPQIGPLGAFDYVYDSSYMFPTYSVGYNLGTMTVAAAANYALPQGKKKLATLVCNEASVCTLFEKSWVTEGPKLGFELVSQGRASLTQPDYTAQCLAARNAGAQVIVTAFAAEGNKRIATNCENVGLKAIKVVTSVQSTLDFKDNPASDDTVVAMPVAPWFRTEIPGVKDYQAQMKKYAAGVPIDMQSVNGWTVAKHFEAAARHLPAGEVRSADILDGLWAMQGDDLGGMTYPLSFTRGKPAARKTCGWVVTLKGGQWTSDGKQFCL